MSENPGVDPVLAETLGIAPATKPAPIVMTTPPTPRERPERARRPRDAKGRLMPKAEAAERLAATEFKPEADRPPAPSRRPTASAVGAGPTRGRPASERMEATAEDGYDDDGLTRRSLDEADGNSFDVPTHLTRRGWVYQWQTQTVLGQPSDPGDMGFAIRQGWRPCTDPHIRGHFMPPTWEKTTIEQRGQILMQRPERLQREAAQEMRAKADKQKMEKMRAAVAAPVDQSPLMPRSVQSLTIEGEIGAYADDPIARDR